MVARAPPAPPRPRGTGVRVVLRRDRGPDPRGSALREPSRSHHAVREPPYRHNPRQRRTHERRLARGNSDRPDLARVVSARRGRERSRPGGPPALRRAYDPRDRLRRSAPDAAARRAAGTCRRLPGRSHRRADQPSPGSALVVPRAASRRAPEHGHQHQRRTDRAPHNRIGIEADPGRGDRPGLRALHDATASRPGDGASRAAVRRGGAGRRGCDR